jgi:hypothetical protein
MKLIILILGSLLLNTSIAFADGAIGKFTWPEYEAPVLADSLKEESVFFLQNIETTDIKDSYLTTKIVFRRVYINSTEAAEEYSQKEMFIGDNGRIGMLNARNIKPDGTILDLDGDQIITTYAETKTKYGSYGTRKVQLTYPNVEVGDVLDIAYRIDIDGYVLSDLFVLESDIPSLYSRITIRNMSPFDITAYSLNNMPEMVSKTTDGYETISWEKEGVGVQKYGSLNALSPTAPHCVYLLWRRGETLDYDMIYAENVRDYPNDFGPKDYITKNLVEEGVINAEDDKMLNLKKLMDYLAKGFNWDEEANSTITSTSIKAFKEKQIDRTHYIRIVIKFMTENDIKFERCYSKSLWDGKFELGFVSIEQLDHFFLIASDESDNIHYIFPPGGEGNFFYFDEIPFFLEGNQSIALYGAKDFLDSQSSIALPQGGKKSNTHYANLLLEIELGDSLVSKMKRKDVFKGQYSFLTRSKDGMDWLEDLNVIADSAELKPNREDSFYPYEIEFLQEDLSEVYLKQIDDSLYWFESERVLPKGVYEAEESSEEFGDYLVLPYLKENRVSVFIKSASPIQLAEDVNELSFENSIGAVNSKLIQMSPNMLKLNFSIEVNKRFVDGELEVQEYADLIKQYSIIKGKKWVVSISK